MVNLSYVEKTLAMPWERAEQEDFRISYKLYNVNFGCAICSDYAPGQAQNGGPLSPK